MASGSPSPGPFDYARGIAWLDHKLEALYGVDLRAPLADGLGLPPEAITFVNDADAFLLGEWWAGAAAGQRRAVGVTLGTGIGSAFLEDGVIVDSGPGVPPGGEIHRDHVSRLLRVEETVSRAALIERYGEPGRSTSTRSRRARARGDERAEPRSTSVATALGEVLAPWLDAFGATCLVVGGSIAAAWDLLEPGLCVRRSGRELERLEDDRARSAARRRGAARRRVPRDATRSSGPVSRARRGARRCTSSRSHEARAAQAAERAGGRGRRTSSRRSMLEARCRSGSTGRRRRGPHPSACGSPAAAGCSTRLAVAEPACRRIAAETPCAVAVVRYRLAPEHRFPTPLDDSLAATRWLVGQADELGLDRRPSRDRRHERGRQPRSSARALARGGATRLGGRRCSSTPRS